MKKLAVLFVMCTGLAYGQEPPTGVDNVNEKLEQMRTQLDKIFVQMFNDLAQLKNNYKELREEVTIINDKLGIVQTKQSPKEDGEMPILKPSPIKTPERMETARAKKTTPRAFFIVQNSWSNPIQLVIKDREQVHRVTIEPENNTNVEIAAGDFTYEIVGVQSALRRTLGANEKFNLKIRPSN